ncbi:hypothetical protein LCGC14_1378550 [marine sediment metagenome]|uniref:DUF1697 domain-containing protein n=2 Tax=root TaxID=1 RepID=A0A831VQT1_9FLAO|nr:DUF1697 domain-containing protein [Pricia sp.]HEA21033.1 DUF1697 domain-containing protein [Pricia antarctica]
MQTYIALLRGINVSGQKKIPMAELKTMMEGLGLQNVTTYIQSGNVVFTSEEQYNTISYLEEKIKKQIQETFAFEVPVLLKSKTSFEEIIRSNPYNDSEAIANKLVYFVLLQKIPEKEKVAAFQKEVYDNEDFLVKSECVYLLCRNGYGRAKLNNNRVERKLKVEATTRNYGTMMKLWEMATD